MSNTRRIKASEVEESRFYKMPKWLIHNESFKKISNDAKILYMIMRDRHELSLKNKWIDADGFIYIIYSRESMQEDLQLSAKPIINAVKELKKYNLIDEVRQGCNKPNLIYVLTVDLDSQWKCQKAMSGSVKKPYPEVEICHANDTNTINTNTINTSSLAEEKEHKNVKLVKELKIYLTKADKEEVKTYDYERLRSIIETHRSKIEAFNYIRQCYCNPISQKATTGSYRKHNAFANLGDNSRDLDFDDLELLADADLMRQAEEYRNKQ